MSISGTASAAAARMPLPKMTVMCARGRDSFVPGQLDALHQVADLMLCPVLAPLSAAEFVERCGDAQILGFTRRAIADFDRGAIDALPKLRAVAIHATGTEWIDLEALRERGIAFASLPDYSAVSVAEHSIAMLLALSRRLHLSERVSRGDLPATVSLRGWELAGKRLGVVGHGRIGSRVARLAEAFGMEVAWSDPAPAVPATGAGVGFDALIERSDVVVLACPQRRGAAPIVGARELERMRPGSYLINPARSTLVDNRAVLSAIRAKTLSGYAVDDKVFAEEALAGIEPGRILQTGHTAWYSDETIARGMAHWVAALTALAEKVAPE